MTLQQELMQETLTKNQTCCEGQACKTAKCGLTRNNEILNNRLNMTKKTHTRINDGEKDKILTTCRWSGQICQVTQPKWVMQTSLMKTQHLSGPRQSFLLIIFE